MMLGAIGSSGQMSIGMRLRTELRDQDDQRQGNGQTRMLLGSKYSQSITRLRGHSLAFWSHARRKVKQPHVPSLRGDAIQPGAHPRERCQLEPAIFGNVRVGV